MTNKETVRSGNFYICAANDFYPEIADDNSSNVLLAYNIPAGSVVNTTRIKKWKTDLTVDINDIVYHNNAVWLNLAIPTPLVDMDEPEFTQLELSPDSKGYTWLRLWQINKSNTKHICDDDEYIYVPIIETTYIFKPWADTAVKIYASDILDNQQEIIFIESKLFDNINLEYNRLIIGDTEENFGSVYYNVQKVKLDKSKIIETKYLGEILQQDENDNYVTGNVVYTDIENQYIYVQSKFSMSENYMASLSIGDYPIESVTTLEKFIFSASQSFDINTMKKDKDQQEIWKLFVENNDNDY